MSMIYYCAAAHFDIEDIEIEVSDTDDDAQIRQKIINDLEERYRLEISYRFAKEYEEE